MGLSLKAVIGIGLGIGAGYFGSRVMEANALGVPVTRELFLNWNTPVARLTKAVAPRDVLTAAQYNALAKALGNGLPRVMPDEQRPAEDRSMIIAGMAGHSHGAHAYDEDSDDDN